MSQRSPIRPGLHTALVEAKLDMPVGSQRVVEEETASAATDRRRRRRVRRHVRMSGPLCAAPHMRKLRKIPLDSRKGYQFEPSGCIGRQIGRVHFVGRLLCRSGCSFARHSRMLCNQRSSFHSQSQGITSEWVSTSYKSLLARSVRRNSCDL